MSDNIRDQLVANLKHLNTVMPEFRKAEDLMKSAKAAVCGVHVEMAAADSKVSNGELARMVEECMKAW